MAYQYSISLKFWEKDKLDGSLFEKTNWDTLLVPCVFLLVNSQVSCRWWTPGFLDGGHPSFPDGGPQDLKAMVSHLPRDRTAHEDMVLTRIYHFEVSINNTSIADKIPTKVQHVQRILHNVFEKALALEAG